MTSEGKSVVPQPVPAAPPTAGDVLRHGASVGFGALGLARRAMGTALGKVQPAERRPLPTSPSTLDLVPGAMAGLALVAERRVRSVVVGVASGTATTVRAVTRPAAVQQALRPLEDLLWSWNEVARREQARNRAEASVVLPTLIQTTAENVIAQLDLARLVSQIPIAEVVEQVDIEGIVHSIDLGGVIRESTAGVGAEAIDALRSQGIALDVLTAKFVDRVLFRRKPRDLEVG